MQKKNQIEIIIDIGTIFKINYKTLISIGDPVECIQIYLLIHDDLHCMDDDKIKKRKFSTHDKFGESILALVGNLLLTITSESNLQYF